VLFSYNGGMKKIILLFTLATSYIFSNINVAVSILPEKSFVEAIGKEKVHVTLMVLPGNSPHTYEPKPSQMKEIAKVALYLSIGVEFEKVWLPKFKNLNPQMHIADLSANITKLPMAGTESHHGTADPHIWTSPANIARIAKDITRHLSGLDPENSAYYHQNLKRFLTKVKETDKHIRRLLSTIPKGTKFMVFHPSWGYFANTYGLTQVPVEVAGKAPKPKALVALIKQAKAEKISAIFTQPEFSDSSARLIASELDIPVIKVTPLAADWSQTLIRIAQAIAGSR